MIPQEKIIVALDTQDKGTLMGLFQKLEGKKVWVKIGMELFYSLGSSVIHDAKARGFKVFLDLKLHDIPNTVGQSIKSLTNLPIDMVNIHALGGSEMMKRAADAIRSGSHPPLLIAVTQLTSTSMEQMNQEQGIQGELQKNVLLLSELAKKSGCHGVVCSAQEVRMIKDKCGSDFKTVTPGIRPKGADVQDQKRIMTPQEAHEMGTDFMVIGRPITGATDPQLALENILKGH